MVRRLLDYLAVLGDDEDSFNLAPRPDFRGWPRLRSRFFGCQKEFFTLARRK